MNSLVKWTFQVTEKQVLPVYLKVVESSYFNSSDKVRNWSKKKKLASKNPGACQSGIGLLSKIYFQEFFDACH